MAQDAAAGGSYEDGYDLPVGNPERLEVLSLPLSRVPIDVFAEPRCAGCPDRPTLA